MRHLFFALMIALLPLRGWVGDVMAAQMTNAALAQPEVAAHHMQHGVAADQTMALHTDCASHDAANSQPSNQGDCGTCSACQICHTVALTLPLQLRTAASPTIGQPQAPHHHFTSAERAAGFKPPIS